MGKRLAWIAGGVAALASGAVALWWFAFRGDGEGGDVTPATDKAGLESIARGAASDAGIEPALLLAIVDTESGWRQSATNLTGGDLARGGAYGLAQMTLRTAQGIDSGATPERLLEPAYNLSLAAQLLGKLWGQYGNDADTVSAYNSGKPVATAPISTRTVYVPVTLAHLAARRLAEGSGGGLIS